MLSEEAKNTNFIVFGLTLSGIEHTIYRTRDEHTIPPPIRNEDILVDNICQLIRYIGIQYLPTNKIHWYTLSAN
jgi:hypothetical protein